MLTGGVAALRPTTRAMRRAFTTWVSNGSERRLLRRGLASWQMRDVLLVFNSWASRTRVALRAEATMRNAALAMQRGLERRALNSWRAYATDHINTRISLRFALASIRRSAERRALNGWIEYAHVRREKEDALHRVLLALHPETRSVSKAMRTSFVMIAAAL